MVIESSTWGYIFDPGDVKADLYCRLKSMAIHVKISLRMRNNYEWYVYFVQLIPPYPDVCSTLSLDTVWSSMLPPSSHPVQEHLSYAYPLYFDPPYFPKTLLS